LNVTINKLNYINIHTKKFPANTCFDYISLHQPQLSSSFSIGEIMDPKRRYV